MQWLRCQLCRARCYKIQAGPELRHALSLLKEELLKAEPVQINPTVPNVWYIFIDGANEPNQQQPGSAGGVLVNSEGQVVEYFGASLGDSLMQEFLQHSKHPIYEPEVFPLAIAMKAWGGKIKGGRVVCCLDNKAARGAFINGYGVTPLAKASVQDFLKHEKLFRVKGWFGRAPTSSNVTDPASRLDFTSIFFEGASKIFVLPTHLCQWGIGAGALES